MEVKERGIFFRIVNVVGIVTLLLLYIVPVHSGIDGTWTMTDPRDIYDQRKDGESRNVSSKLDTTW